MTHGFDQAEHVLIVLYVDDAGVCTMNKHDIDELICRLTKCGFECVRDPFLNFLASHLFMMKRLAESLQCSRDS